MQVDYGIVDFGFDGVRDGTESTPLCLINAVTPETMWVNSYV